MANIKIQNNGFVMAFSLLLSSIVLALAFGIFNLLLKQISLTSSTKDSQIAFYAADAGMECALYWDTHNSRDTSSYPNSQLPWDYTGMFGLSANNPDYTVSYPAPATVAIEIADPTKFSCGVAGTISNISVTPYSSFTSIQGVPADVAVSVFSLNVTDDAKVCAVVFVFKRYNSPVVAGNPKSGFDTIVESRGYNDCDASNNKRVERAVEVKY